MQESQETSIASKGEVFSGNFCCKMSNGDKAGQQGGERVSLRAEWISGHPNSFASRSNPLDPGV